VLCAACRQGRQASLHSLHAQAYPVAHRQGVVDPPAATRGLGAPCGEGNGSEGANTCDWPPRRIKQMQGRQLQSGQHASGHVIGVLAKMSRGRAVRDAQGGGQRCATRNMPGTLGPPAAVGALYDGRVSITRLAAAVKGSFSAPHLASGAPSTQPPHQLSPVAPPNSNVLCSQMQHAS
jgi:hypothetical protein